MDAEAIAAELQRARDLGRRLQIQRRDLAAMAGGLAATEDEVARVHEDIEQADNSAIAAQAAEVARSSRAFAEHERQVQRRLSDPAG